MIYMQNRSFLRDDHPLRRDDQSFPCRLGDTRECLTSKPVAPAYMELVERHSLYDNAKTQAQRAFVAKSYGCKGSYAFMKLPNHDRTTNVHPDAMHTVTNVITTLVALLSGHINVKTVLLEEEDFGRGEWCSTEAPLALVK